MKNLAVVCATFCAACGARSELDVAEARDAARPLDGSLDGAPDAPQRCPPAKAPTLLASFPEGAWLELAQDDAYVYWASGNSDAPHAVRRVGKCGGATQVLFMGQVAPSGVAAGALDVYFAAGISNDSVYALPKDGGAVSVVGPTSGNRFLLLDDSTLYLSSFESLASLPIGGGTPTLLAAGAFGASATDATLIYALEANAGVVAIPKKGGAATTLAPTPNQQGAVVVDGATVIYSGWFANSDGFVRQVTAGKITSLAENLALPEGIAVDATHVYFAEQGPSIGNGSVSSVPRSGGSPTVLASAQDRPEALIADATSLYWLNFGGQVMKLDKP